MFIALNSEGERVEASAASRSEKYYCPVCGTEVIPKIGEIYRHHFAHTVANEICPFAMEGESEEHEAMKKSIKWIIERDNKYLIKSELEYIIKDETGEYKVADYYCETPRRNVAVEVVHKHTDNTDFEEKIRFYTDNNIHCMWVFNKEIFNNDVKPRTSQIHRSSHWLNYGKILTYDVLSNKLFATHLEKPPYSRWKSKRIIISKPIEYCKLYFNENSINGVTGDELKQLLASPYVERQFWDKD